MFVHSCTRFPQQHFDGRTDQGEESVYVDAKYHHATNVRKHSYTQKKKTGTKLLTIIEQICDPMLNKYLSIRKPRLCVETTVNHSF